MDQCGRSRYMQLVEVMQALFRMSDDQTNKEIEIEHSYQPRQQNGRTVWTKHKLPKTQSKCSLLSPVINLKQLAKKPRNVAKSLGIVQKKIWFDAALRKQRQTGAETIDLLIRREFLFQDSYNQFRTTSDFDPKREVRINFVDEPGQDIGGVMRDWFSALMKQIFSKGSKFFIPDERGLYRIDPSSEELEDYQGKFEFIGNLFGKALFERIPISAPLSPILLTQLISANSTFNLKDLKLYDSTVFKSLLYIEQNSVQSLDFKFAVEQNGKMMELVKDGLNIPVNETNKNQFIQQMVNFYLKKECQTQLAALRKGLVDIISQELLGIFSVPQFELILTGTQEIDVQDWKRNTFYLGDYSEQHKVIRWFWNVVEKLNGEEKKTFLQFCTGLSTVPVEGFANLRSHYAKVARFSIAPTEFITSELTTIKAHTCFNRIELPTYLTRQELEKNIKGIIAANAYYRFDFD